jgi:hypothetical protein
MKSLFLYYNRANVLIKYDTSNKVSEIIQNLQKILRKYLHYFFSTIQVLKVKYTNGINRYFCPIIVRNNFLNMNQVLKIQ